MTASTIGKIVQKRRVILNKQVPRIPWQACNFCLILSHDSRWNKTLLWSHVPASGSGLETMGKNHKLSGFSQKLLLHYKQLQRKSWYVPGMVAPERFLYAYKTKFKGCYKRKPDWINTKFQPCFTFIFILTISPVAPLAPIASPVRCARVQSIAGRAAKK